MKIVKPAIAIVGAAALTLGVALTPAAEAAGPALPAPPLYMELIYAEVGTDDMSPDNAAVFLNGYRYNCGALVHNVEQTIPNFVRYMTNGHIAEARGQA